MVYKSSASFPSSSGSGVGTGVTTFPYSEVPAGSVNGSNTNFTLTYAPLNPAGIQVVLNGGIQKNGVDYTMSGNTINFVTAPANGSIVYAFYNDQISTSTFNMPYDETPGGLINGSNTAYTLTYTPASATSLQVVLNGNVLLPTTDYTLSGTTITTTFAPATGSQIYAFYNVVGVYTTYAEVPSGTVNSSNKVFTLVNAPNPAVTLQVCLNGRVQTYGTDYTLSGSTITFVAAPATNSKPYAFYSTISAGGGSQTPWTSNINGGGYNLTNTASITSGQFNLSQDGSNQSGIAWEPYVGGTTLQGPTSSTVYIQGAGETSLGSILMYSPVVHLYGGGSGVLLETQGTDQLTIESSAGINIFEIGYGINISAPEDVSISSAGAVQCSGAEVIMNGVNIDSGSNLTANSLNANNGFTGTGSYSSFTIVNGIITSAS